jgi:LysR family transcriptional regulator, benzoate and cis,cis-muconate-responsive activator of ben and cat genes
MELRQLRYFKAVAELLNFSRASEQLHVAQSALSRQIQTLEHELGTKLLDRDRSRVALTDAGKTFLPHVAKLLLHVDVAVTEVRQIARGSTGELVICADWRSDAQFVSSAVERFRADHPRVDVSLREADYKQQLALLRSGQAHVGFVAREFIGRRGEFEFLSIEPVHVNVYLPPGHRFARKKTVRLADLAKETWIDVSEQEAAGFRAFFIQQCRLSGYTPKIGRTASSLDALFGHVASGYGITVAPDHLRPRPGITLTCVPTDCPPIEFGAVYRANNPSLLLRDFVDVLRAQIQAR